MSTLKNPVGPQSSRVYWRRRIVVGLGLLAVIVIIALIVGRPGASTSAEKDPDPSADTAVVTEETPDPAAGAIAECTAAQVEVTPVVDASEFPAGVTPNLSFTIANTGTEACTINAGTTTQVYTVTSGEDVIWTSTDCQTEPVDAVVTLLPDSPMSSDPVAWERVRSTPDTCDVAEREPVVAGGATYNLTVEVGGIPSTEPKSFLLY